MPNAPRTIVLLNRATTPLGFDLCDFTVACQHYVDDYLVPAWGEQAAATFATGGDGPGDDLNPGESGLIFLDNADQPGALAYHEAALRGQTLSLVFLQDILRANASASVAASHEIVEQAVDPSCTKLVRRKSGILVAKEIADPVEADESGFRVNGFLMSDFVHPAYFREKPPPGAKLDQTGAVTAPFQIAPGGYMEILRDGQWIDVFGSPAKRLAFAQEDRRLHRSERRRLQIEDAAA